MGREIQQLSPENNFSAGQHTLYLDGESLVPGIYFIEAEIDGENTRAKNCKGKIRKLLQLLNETIDLTSQPKGIYFIELHHDTGVEVQRVVIQ